MAVTSLGIEYAIYDLATGNILEVRRTLRMATAQANCPEGKGLFVGHVDPKTERIVNGENVARSDRSRNDMLDAVAQEYSRRLAAGFEWNGARFQCDEQKSQPRITSMGALAGQKLGTDLADSLRWFNPQQDFFWIAADNSQVSMTANQMVDFAASAALFASSLIIAAASLKRLDPIPPDMTDNRYWS